MTKPRTPYVDLVTAHADVKAELLEAVARVLDHGLYILGPEVSELERRLAEYIGSHAVVGVSSGTSALRMALRLNDIGSGDEVATVSHSFVATASAIVLEGARPVFFDIDDETSLADPADLEKALTPATRAVVVVHLNGQPLDTAPFAELCRAKGLALIEDSAQGIGTRYAGEHVGRTGIGCFSTHPLKVLGGFGDGGFVTVHNDEQRGRVQRLRNLGLRDRDHCDDVADNERLDTLQAAMLLVELARLEERIEHRQRVAALYRERLGRFEAAGLRFPPADPPGNRTTYSAFVVRHPERDRLRAVLEEHGVDARSHYPLGIHQQKAFTRFTSRPLPVTERVVSEILSLPVHAGVTEDTVERAANALAALFGVPA